MYNQLKKFNNIRLVIYVTKGDENYSKKDNSINNFIEFLQINSQNESHKKLMKCILTHCDYTDVVSKSGDNFLDTY